MVKKSHTILIMFLWYETRKKHLFKQHLTPQSFCDIQYFFWSSTNPRKSYHSTTNWSQQNRCRLHSQSLINPIPDTVAVQKLFNTWATQFGNMFPPYQHEHLHRHCSFFSITNTLPMCINLPQKIDPNTVPTTISCLSKTLFETSNHIPRSSFCQLTISKAISRVVINWVCVMIIVSFHNEEYNIWVIVHSFS